MRTSEWVDKFNYAVKSCEDRPDHPRGDIVYRVKEIFTTLLGSWEPSSGYGAIPQWARDAYLKPWGAADYFDDAGADHSLFALVLDLDGKPVKTGELVRFWSDGFSRLGDASYRDYAHVTPKPGSGWARLDIYNNFVPERGEQGAWCWCPEGAADVVVGGGLPNNHHVSTFVVWQAERRAAGGGTGGGTDTGGGTTTGSTAAVNNHDIVLMTSPKAVIPGRTAAVAWLARSVKAIFLDEKPVTERVTRTVTPTQPTHFTVRVELTDGDNLNYDVTVTATGKPTTPADPGKTEPPVSNATRPPTAVLTPENIAHLRQFPRPAADNGRGLHFSIDLRDESIAATVANLRSIGARWTLIYAQDELQAGRAATSCWTAGIMPVVRIGARLDQNFDAVAYVNALKAIGAPPYVQIYNEPADDREWKPNVPPNWLQIFGERWAYHASRVFDAGGYPGLQVLEREELDAAIDAVAAMNRTDIWQRAFFCTHNYGANHPPAYPYDIGKTVFDDFYGVLSFLAFAKWMQERIGFVLPIIGGEGGWQWGSDQDKRYPKVADPLHGQYHREMFDWFRTGVLSNGEPLPDYLFSITPWIAGGWGADDWWGGALGTKTETIAAVQSLPPFVRKFSWG